MSVGGAGFAEVGENVTIYELVRIISPERIAVGSHVLIDDFVFIQGGAGLRIGSHVHLASHSSITGGGTGTLGNFVSLGSGARVLTGTDLSDGTGLINPTIPARLRAVQRGSTTLCDHVFVGANAVVFPGLVLGTGAVVGAGSVVTTDLDPWTIYVGAPARSIKRRPSERILRYAAELGFEAAE